ncbi:MAG: DUF4395 domain-containing protein [Nocardioidaceae bacterium]
MSTSTQARTGTTPAGTPRIDPRGPRFAATLTTVLLAVALVAAPSTLTVVLLAVQTVLFALGAGLGIGRTPYAWAFKTFVRPRLGAPSELEDPEPPRFAQTVGLVFAVVALAGYLTGADLLGAVATGFALAAAFLNAAFGFCLGCELYLLGKRLRTA